VKFNYTRLFFGAIFVISAIGFAMAVSVDRSRVQSVPSKEVHAKWQWDYATAEQHALRDKKVMTLLERVRGDIVALRAEIEKQK